MCNPSAWQTQLEVSQHHTMLPSHACPASPVRLEDAGNYHSCPCLSAPFPCTAPGAPGQLPHKVQGSWHRAHRLRAFQEKAGMLFPYRKSLTAPSPHGQRAALLSSHPASHSCTTALHGASSKYDVHGSCRKNPSSKERGEAVNLQSFQECCRPRLSLGRLLLPQGALPHSSRAVVTPGPAARKGMLGLAWLPAWLYGCKPAPWVLTGETFPPLCDLKGAKETSG